MDHRSDRGSDERQAAAVEEERDEQQGLRQRPQAVEECVDGEFLLDLAAECAVRLRKFPPTVQRADHLHQNEARTDQVVQDGERQLCDAPVQLQPARHPEQARAQ